MKKQKWSTVNFLSLILFFTVIMACSDTGQPIKGVYSNESGYCWYISLPEHASSSDSMKNPSVSTLQLFEDGKKMGPAHSGHDDIRKLGMGRYSHWGEGVLFSTTDNSNPNTNKKIYSIKLK
jgi:hypothetical protein